MTDYKPLYSPDGRRDKARRYVSPEGNIISRRQYIKKTEGETPEQKAIRRYLEGLTDRKPRSAPKRIPVRRPRPPPEPGIRWRVANDIPYADRGSSAHEKLWQMMVVIDAINAETGEIRPNVPGYSRVSSKKDAERMSDEAFNHALASLGGAYDEWLLYRIVRRMWLRIVRRKK